MNRYIHYRPSNTSKKGKAKNNNFIPSKHPFRKYKWQQIVPIFPADFFFIFIFIFFWGEGVNPSTQHSNLFLLTAIEAYKNGTAQYSPPWIIYKVVPDQSDSAISHQFWFLKGIAKNFHLFRFIYWFAESFNCPWFRFLICLLSARNISYIFTWLLLLIFFRRT